MNNATTENPSPASFRSLTDLGVTLKVVDIGANPIDGAPPYACLLRDGLADIVGFEPNPAALEKLNAAKGPRETYLPHAVGDGKRHTLRLCQAPGMTSLFEPNPDILNLFHGFPAWGRVLAREEVETVRLDDVPQTSGAHFLKLDIQGAELMVLQNAEARLRDALIIHAEVEFLPLYRDQPLFSDVEQFLRSRGFLFHRFFPQTSRVIQPLLVGNNIYAGLSQLVWADGIFVRDFTRLDRLGDDQLLQLATIMHDCYQSIDLVLHLLNEHDRRSGQRLGPRYLAALTGAANPVAPAAPKPRATNEAASAA